MKINYKKMYKLCKDFPRCEKCPFTDNFNSIEELRDSYKQANIKGIIIVEPNEEDIELLKNLRS